MSNLTPATFALASASTKNLLNEYHRLAADTLLGQQNNHIDQALLSASEDGQYDRLQTLLSNPTATIDARCPLTGDTPLIAAARKGHDRVVELLISMGADVTIQNDLEESALEVASKKIKQILLNSIRHDGRVMSNAQALLQNAWLGDAVSVKKHIESGGHYLDVNCHNNDGMTPLLLVTRDINLFDSIQIAMETEYNPVDVVQDLIDNHADINHRDPKGRSALHFVAKSENVHARKMVSLLMRRGSTVDSLDSELHSPLHIASGKGHTAIIIALVEEGGADINSKGGERNDTPLMLTARAGHSEAARYLLAKGADVTAVDDNGDSALSVAATSSMVTLLKEAWSEQTMAKEEEVKSADSAPDLSSPSHDPCSPISSSGDDRGSDFCPLSPRQQGNGSFFMTDQRLSRSWNALNLLDGVSGTGDGMKGLDEPDWKRSKQGSFHPQRVSETEADDELDGDLPHKRIKPATRRAHVRAGFEETIAKRRSAEVKSPRVPPACVSKSQSLPRNLAASLDPHGYSSPDEDHVTHQGGVADRGNKISKSREDKKAKQQNSSQRLAVPSNKPRPLRLTIPLTHKQALSRSHDNLVGVVNKVRDKKDRHYLPNVIKNQSSPQHTQPSHPLSDKLPSLNNMKAVAMVAVDTDQDKLKVQKFDGDNTPKVQRSNRKESVQRSKSYYPMNRKPSEVILNFSGKRRNSNGSVPTTRKSDPTPPSSKATLLPNVITPQLHIGMFNGPSDRGGGANHTQFTSRGRGRLQPLNVSKTTPLSPVSKMLSPSSLSIVTEATESDRTLTQTKSFPELHGSKDSTLKASSVSDFDADSLEGSITTVTRDIIQTKAEPSSANAPSPLDGSVFNVFPPSPSSVHPQSNLVVNYARGDGTTPLSPIWNRMQYLHSDTDTSSNSEYITSYIGRSTPLLQLQTPEGNRTGADSGQGESSDEDPADNSDDSDDMDEEGESLRWKRGRLLGKGAYGKVWEGLLDSAKLIAVKEVELDYASIEKAQSQYEKIQLEVDILRSLRHKNVVSYLGTSMQEGLVFIFMDYISGGSLQSVLKRFGPLDCRTIIHYTKQITRALLYLHLNAIIHRDIKGANIMVTTKGIIKLIDFGCAKRYCQETGGAGMHSVRGTPYWMSPEVICGHGYGRKSDIWSLGCTVHEMAVTKPPWADFPPESAMFQIGIGKSIPELPDHLPAPLITFIHRCLTRDQADRPSAAELLEDQFLILPAAKKTSRS